MINSNCSKLTRFLICSSLFPLCTPDVDKPVTACKLLCETVKSDCSNSSVGWPEFLNCDTFPQPDKEELCMKTPQEEKQENSTQSSTSTTTTEATTTTSKPYIPAWSGLNWPQTKLIHHSLQHEFNFEHRPLMHPIICPLNFTAIDDRCVASCNRDAMYTGVQKKITEALILALSAGCFVLTLFSLVTFWAEPTRFGYPERPVLFLCLCYNLFSLSYLERVVFHNPRKEGLVPLDITQCHLTPPCIASYITTSYLTLCACSWWLIFALCFYLSSNKRWSSEALEKKSGLFHILAWVPPLFPPIAALMFGSVSVNELTGMCSAPGFVEIPAFILLLLGIIFTERAVKSLKVLQEQIRSATGTQRFSQIRKRFLLFSLVFFVPSMLSMILGFFERLEPKANPCLTRDTCVQPEKQTSIPVIMKIFFHLAGGTLTGMWVWSRKTCESYRSRLTPSNPMLNLTKTNMITPCKAFTKHNTSALPIYSGINFHNVPIYSERYNHVIV